jgi:heterodisulfide reductase subunit A
MAMEGGGPGSVVVVGGGLAGVQAALELATAGARVHLVEASPALGGTMAQLDKTFPTNDCSVCILSPILVEASRHPNIALHTLSRVTALAGEAGAFRARIETAPRYVDPTKCTACGLCAQKCPVKVPSEFDRGLDERSAIYTPFPQAVPSTYRIDPDACRYLKEGKCGLCAKVCPAKAVHYTMRPAVAEVEASAVIVATGAVEWDPAPLAEMGWGRSPDVVTALQLERLLSASGPTGGRLERPSDHQEPRRIAWVHCAGSRDERHVPYCSRVCCMYSAKEAVIAAEHAPGLERLDLFHIDVRAFGKGFHEYVERAAADGRIRPVRARVAQVEPDGNGRLAVLHEDPHTGDVREDAYDMVVLAVPLVPPPGARGLAGALGVEADAHGFIVEPDPFGRPCETSRPGVLVAGMAAGPRDITDTVLGAGAAAASALRWATAVPPAEPAALPRPAPGRERLARIGVFVCHCGINIAGVVDVEAVCEAARAMPGVVHAEHNLFTCSSDTQEVIKRAIDDNGLTRVIVAACTPRTHEPLFRRTCEAAGLNPYLFEMANIREHCSWVHQHDHEAATAKAVDLVRMAVGRAARLEALDRMTVAVEPRVLVVGGGIAGAHAALAAAEGGRPVTLVERADEVGGRLLELDRLSPTDADARAVAGDLRARLEAVGVDVRLGSEVRAIGGFVGNF